MFRERSGINITPQEVLIICLLNTIQVKTMLIKVQEQMTERSTWEEVRIIIIKIDNASRLSDAYKLKNRYSGATVQTKACKGNNTGKAEKDVKPSASQERRAASEEKRKRDLSAYRKANGSPVLQHNSCVQVQTMGNFLSGTHSDSDEDSYKTPPETESEPENDDDPNAPELSEDDLENDEEVKELLNRPENDSVVSLHSFLKFLDILNLKTADQGASNSDTKHSNNYPPSHSCRRRSKSPIFT